MKFFVKSLPVALVALMLNCSKSSPSPSPVVGTWTRNTNTYSGCTNSAYNSTTTYVCPPPSTTLGSSCDQTTFNSNGTVKIESVYKDSSGYYNIVTLQGTYSIHGTQLTETVAGKTTTFTFGISADKKTLITTYENDTTGCTVKDVYTK